VDIVFWQVSGALIGMAAGSAAAVWGFGLNLPMLVLAVFAGLVAGGAFGTFFGAKRGR
jgi:hypothetical protein